jgi:hypothetical protein
MIASARLEFQEDGAEFVSPVRGAPGSQRGRRRGAGPDGPAAGQARFLARALLRLPLAARVQGQFAPRYEPIHLAFRDEADLPRIGVALTRAYLPDAMPRQLLAAGLSAHGQARAENGAAP